MLERADRPMHVRVLGVLLAAVLAVAAAPAVRADAAEAGTRVTTGTISWGLKTSFRNYITGPIAHGEVTTGAPATAAPDGFTFPAAAGTWGDASDVAAQGSVRFEGHDGVLDLTISRPRLVTSGDSARLEVDAVVNGDSRSGIAIADVDLAGRVTSSGSKVTVAGAPAVLTQAGAALFSYEGSPMYEAGTALDPVSAQLTLATVVEPTDPEPTEPGPTEPTEPAPTTPPANDTKVTGGSLAWGLKQSFRSYLKMGFVAGATEALAPATDDGTRTTFSSASGTWSSRVVDVRTSGGVRFTGHHGVLDFTVRNLRLVVDGTRSELRADVRDSEGNDLRNLAFATVDLRGRAKVARNAVTIAGAPVTLTRAGEAMFDYSGSPMYGAGTALDPLNGTITVKGATAPPKTAPVAQPGKVTQPKGDRSRGGRAGELTWGVKASFRSYITGPIAKGSVSVSGGASSTGSGYRFGQFSTTATPPNPQGSTSYRGGVKFFGHHGTLDLTISQPSVRVTSGTSATLSASVTGRGRVDLATLDLAAAQRSTESGWVRYAGAPARLTAAGAGMFSYQGRAFYAPGSLLDPVTFSVGSVSSGGAANAVVAATTSDDWTPPATPPATTGLTLEQDEVRAGDQVTASGSGFLPGETGIKVVLYSSPIVLAENVTADAAGRATWKGTIPATLEPGKHTLTFQGSVDRGIVIDVAEAEKIVGCELSDARLDWGFKESFRAYVSGSIANGDWTTQGDASYETPEFTWSKGEGVLDETTRAGELEFGGTVVFTGHDGALDTTIANPSVTMTDAESATLSVDYTGGTMDAAMAGKDDRRTIAAVPFADLDLGAGEVSENGQTVTISGIPATLTSAGSAAFPNYETGAALDPVTLTYTVAKDCATVAAQPAAGADDAAAVAIAPLTPTASRDWLVWIGATVLLMLAAIAGTVLVMRRRTPGLDA
ncbi:HtaA domain-containing protein [Aeromicrobium phoceense]|uniref:HtaA domain-containing protein n=1 Tax=Aeromicrobium phoceense TaxID=2754045 RepID=UPI0028A6E6C2|nr:HtaA domain-containing protein [Aeromicrobium phoceense]